MHEDFTTIRQPSQGHRVVIGVGGVEVAIDLSHDLGPTMVPICRPWEFVLQYQPRRAALDVDDRVRPAWRAHRLVEEVSVVDGVRAHCPVRMKAVATAHPINEAIPGPNRGSNRPPTRRTPPRPPH